MRSLFWISLTFAGLACACSGSSSSGSTGGNGSTTTGGTSGGGVTSNAASGSFTGSAMFGPATGNLSGALQLTAGPSRANLAFSAQTADGGLIFTQPDGGYGKLTVALSIAAPPAPGTYDATTSTADIELNAGASVGSNTYVEGFAAQSLPDGGAAGTWSLNLSSAAQFEGGASYTAHGTLTATLPGPPDPVSGAPSSDSANLTLTF